MALAVAGTDLLVTGEDLSDALAGLLASMQPPVNIHYVSRDDTLAALGGPPSTERPGLPMEVGNPEAVLAVVDTLNNINLGWMRRLIANARLPLVVITRGDPDQRSSLRERVREVGAIDCLLRDELSAPLLEAAIAHARNHGRQTARLAELRERFSLAIRGARDGMWEWDLVRGRVFYSQRWRELLGLPNDGVAPSLDTWLTRVHPQDIDRLRANLDALMHGHIPVHEHEHRIRDADNQWRWVLSHAVLHRNVEGQAIRMAGSLTDISPYRKRERALREQARHDSLTNLPDRRVFLERCARCVELARAHDDYMFVVLLIEIDRLAQIRDSFGIDAADRVVALLAKRLRGCLRPEDLLFRFSAGKFAILIEDVDEPSFGTHVANRIHDTVAQPFEVDGTTTYTTVSIGMTSSAHGYRRVEDVVTDVSAATDTARDRGRNRHEIYDTSMRIESRTLLALEMALRDALDKEQFQLHYQPIFEIDDSGRGRARGLVGFEALLRLEHPERGRVSPAEFIPIAEDTGLIIPIGRWALRKAVRTLHGFHEEFGQRNLCVSVNLSAKQVGDPLLLEAIDEALAETGLPPECLKLELTESVMMDRIDEVSALLQDIRKRGVQVWIDDFGTGYSSLGHLHRFPVDGLKIDRSFVSALDGTLESESLIRTILGLAHNLGLAVVAEGIETETQAKQLVALGCTTHQGWLWGKPLEAERVRLLLMQR
ncbi:MAG TPA: EAL domain-containing protein [Enhygromyxa sp.]|nr:EAL domain-containing protein [Enhygromyxa sp.]